MVSKDAALLNDVPQGAYVIEVVSDSPADKAGVEINDIIVEFDGKKVAQEDGGLAEVISGKKVGDAVKVRIFRDGKTLDFEATLAEAPTE